MKHSSPCASQQTSPSLSAMTSALSAMPHKPTCILAHHGLTPKARQSCPPVRVTPTVSLPGHYHLFLHNWLSQTFSWMILVFTHVMWDLYPKHLKSTYKVITNIKLSSRYLTQRTCSYCLSQ